jgi:apolipoprotein N-acyltransferase
MEAKEFIDLVQKHIVVWPESEDSQLWNRRVDALIEMVNEAERKKSESTNGEG